MPETTLRDRTRRAVAAELAEAAQALFLEHGYAETTVEAIAARAGMSRRSFFRYFSSKEDLIAQKYGAWSAQMTASLEARPDDEDPWTALRRTFDDITGYYADPARREQVVALQDIVDANPGLSAAVLAVFASLQSDLAGVLVTRTASSSDRLDLATATALTTTAWAAVQAALARAAHASYEDLAARIDEAMAYLRPAGLADDAAT